MAIFIEVIWNVIFVVGMGAAVYFGSRLGVKHANALTTVKVVEEIDDREGPLCYHIEIGKMRRKYFWRMTAHHHDERAEAQTLRVGALEIQIGGGGMGGPYKTRDEALGEALRCLEKMR